MITDHLRMPLRFLRGSYTRLALTVIALALGVALVCAIDLVNRAVLRAFVEVVDTMAGRAALQVTAGQTGLFSEEVAATIGAVPGVELAVPVVSATAFTADDSGELLTVHAVDITNEKAVRIYDARDKGGIELDDPLIFLNQPDSVVLTRAFASRRGLTIGDGIELMTPNGRHSFTVRGLLEPEGVARAYGGNLVVMDLYAAQAVFTHPGFINRVDVVVERQADVARVSDAIAAALPGGLHVDAPSQRKSDLHKVMQSLQTVLTGLGLVGLLAGFLIAFNRLSTVFERRAWLLGVMHAVGVQRRVTLRCLLTESLLLGAIGVAVGIPLGIAVAWALLPRIATTTALAYNLIAPDTELLVSTRSLLLAIALGFAAALAAAALPAWRAAQLGVTETIRGRGREQEVRTAPSMWLVRLSAALGIAGAVWLQSATHSATWGLVATALIATATALAARPLVHVVGAFIQPGLGWMAGPCGRFAAASLLHNPRRIALTAGTLGVGVGCVFWLWMLARSFEQSVIDTMTSAFRVDLLVSSPHTVSGFLTAPIDDELMGEIRRLPGVTAVAAQRIVEWTYAGKTVGLHTFDPVYLTNSQFGRLPLLGRTAPGTWDAVARGDAVVVSSSFPLNFGVQAGDSIALETPSGQLDLRVVGITMDFVSPEGTIEMSRAVFQKYWHDTKVTDMMVQTAPGAADTVRAAIASNWGRSHGLRVLSSADFVEHFAGQVRRAFAGLHIVSAMVLFVVLIGVADTLAAGVTERTRELGSIRALGIQRRHLRYMVLVEGTIVGALGLTLALCAGFALGTLWVEATFPYLLGWTLQYYIPVRQLAQVSFISFLVCLVAGLLPASRAARVDPAVALRYE